MPGSTLTSSTCLNKFFLHGKVLWNYIVSVFEHQSHNYETPGSNLVIILTVFGDTLISIYQVPQKGSKVKGPLVDFL